MFFFSETEETTAPPFPKKIYIQIPGACEYIMVIWQKGLCRWTSGFPGGPNVITWAPKSGRAGHKSQRDAV